MNTKKLIELYRESSKHSHYQILASPLARLIPNNAISTHSRYERERLEYITKHIDIEQMSLLDIGGNTGYFTFEIASMGARNILYIEGNTTHCDFVAEATNALGYEDRIKIKQGYISFDVDFSDMDIDVTLLLNVLHHVGDDFGDKHQSLRAAKDNILRSLSRLSPHTTYLAFQLGFNWKGDTRQGLFDNGEKREMIDFVMSGTEKDWEIESIGVAEKINDCVVFCELNSENIKRNDELGEFLNRPLFIMKSKICRAEITSP